jgi:hypothetical protein
MSDHLEILCAQKLILVNETSRWKNYFSQLLNVHRASDVRQIQIPLVPDPSPCEVEIAIAKLKRYK